MADAKDYILLEHASVVLECAENLPFQKWIDVDLRTSEHQTQSVKEGCAVCDVLVRSNGDGNVYINPSDVPPFHGTVNDIRSCKNCDRNRSDAALAVGLFMACQDIATIVRLKVVFHETSPSPDGKISCSLLFFVVFPHVEESACLRLPKKNQKTWLLDPASQLLLLLVQSDQKKLERRLKALENDSSSEKHVSFFPRRLGLESVYERIQAEQKISQWRPSPVAVENSPLASLPNDIILERLSPFLDATILSSMRCTCRHFHHLLGAVVPGLKKLRLYEHQLESLRWMRRREARAQSEHAAWGQTSQLHRALTAGATTTLSSGRVLDTRTGRQVDSPPPLSREGARGGLLCDDPGLGKTITVLSLILQTSTNLKAAARSPPPEGQKAEVSDSERIFDLYWEESVVQAFRAPALLKILNRVAKLCPAYMTKAMDSLRKAVTEERLGPNFKEFENTVE